MSDEYCLYLRKSRADMEAEAHGEGETLARHERLLLETAKRLKLNVTQIYREIVSGDTIAARPVMQQLLQEVQDGRWKGVLVVEIERLARGDTIDQGIVAQTFKYSETEIVTPLKTYNPYDDIDEEYFEFGLFMSRREYKTINRRLQRGREAASKEGKFVGGSPPYGYERVRVENGKGWMLKIVPEEAEVVRLIFKLYTEGEVLEDGSVCSTGVQHICSILEDMGIKAPGGGVQWFPRTVNFMLSNPAYVGKIRWGRRRIKRVVVDGSVEKVRRVSPPEEQFTVDGLHEPIIDEETFARASEKIANRPAPLHPSQVLKNPFAGIAVCEKCGTTLVRNVGRSGGSGSIKCPNHLCDNVGASLDIFEERVIAALEGWLADYKLHWQDGAVSNTDATISVARSSLKKAEKELETLNAQLERTHDLLEQGVYDTDTFLERSRSLADRIASAKELISTLRSTLAEAELRAQNQKNIVPKVEKLLDVYWQLPDAQSKNEMLKEILEKVTYRRDVNHGPKGPRDNFEIVLYPKLP